MSQTPARYVPDGAPRPYAPATQTTIYRGARVWDGTGTPMREAMAIVVDGERIAAVVPESDLGAHERASAVDLDGAYLIPGLIDSHQHLATPPNRPEAEALLRRQVYGGITTIRDMADDLRHLADLARGTLVGEIPGPDIAYASLMAGPSFFDDPRTHAVSRGAVAGQVPWMLAVTEDTDLRLAVAAARGTGAIAIKVYADLEADLVARIVEHAHEQGMQVWSHATVFPASPRECTMAGVDALSHVTMLPYQLLSDDAPLTYGAHRREGERAQRAALAASRDAFDSLLTMMAERGTVLDATAALTIRSPEREPDETSAEVASWLTGRARELGVVVSAGTDFEELDAAEHPALLGELEFLVERAGFTPEQALSAATAGGARSLGRPDQVGTVSPGRLANFVVLAHNPLDDIAHLRTVLCTLKRGRAFDRADFAWTPPTTPLEH